MAYQTASAGDIDSVVPEEFGGMWFFREPLGCENLGMTLLELDPGAKGKPHDHAEDGQEEVYLVVDGALTVRVGGEGGDPEAERTLSEGEAIRVDGETHRALFNEGDERVRVVIAGAP
ncbi:cupin 2 barrel domain protein [Natronomonas moolapensis 8.8.11]|uniref:Cupin 2 barrel domain protein n=1 Tax=Natronomonas moolapensis (strain DSM 18674 / CECT 7526 / JCM 14361 / 8.8.11) TaxID=268739 RepID=M1Y2M2_NATM8|nr:cupin domain-containing protein [Natronomonas moolapensis]CCQ36754.1 cupin 2 barrel domain protein [Natronomonas moolapensis 8.8.11]